MIIKETFKKYLMILPAGLVYLSMVLFPIGFTFYASVCSWKGAGFEMKYIGLYNYIHIFKEPRFLTALENNFIWMFAYLIIPVLFGFIIALILTNGLRGENLFKAGFYIPGVISFIVIGLMFTFVFDSTNGMINDFLKVIGLGKFALPWLGTRSLGLFSVIMAGSWQYVGFCMVVFLAGLRNIPLDVLEAADIDGANYFQKVIHIMIPLLRPVITVVVGITIINSVRIFDVVYTMTKGGPANSTEVLGLLMYSKAFQDQQWGIGSAYGVIMFIMTSVFGLTYIKQMIRAEVAQ